MQKRRVKARSGGTRMRCGVPSHAVTVLGGLPVIAEVTFTRGDGWMTDDDASVDALYWIKRDGTAGALVSQKIYDRLEKHDAYWEADVTEQVSEALAYEAYEAKQIKLPI